MDRESTMTTVPQNIGVDEDLVQVYDQLAEATGRARDQLFVEALRLYARTKGRQIIEVRRTLAALEAGTLESVAADAVIAQFLAAGRIRPASLAEAEERYDIPPEQQTH
jgi:predicted transcriptional regulator